MKVLVLGAGGFIGRNVSERLSRDNDVVRIDRGGEVDGKVDLLSISDVEECLLRHKPDVIVNCAGTVENSPQAYGINPVITFNILSTIERQKLSSRVIICGSAGEYGIVDSLPVIESAPLRAVIDYAKSKIIEEAVASYFSEKGLTVSILRIFNPIGPGMHNRFLIPSLVRQLKEIDQGEKTEIEISRLDAERDYVDVRDIAEAISAVALSEKSSIYNVGSGKGTSNGELLDLIVKSYGAKKPKVVETSPNKEPQYATEADVSKIKKELGWSVSTPLTETVKAIVEENL